MKAVIVLPTYNEADNIEPFLSSVFEEIEKINNFEIEVLVVDDYSPDGTAEIVKKLQEHNNKIHLLLNSKRGLGNAYIAGFKWALENISPDILVEMDSDFSHDPKKLQELLNPIEKGYDFVIGSRYIPGGSIPDNWPYIRKLNSRYGNLFARFIASIPNVKDCTSGFRALKADLIREIDLDNLKVNGYAFQMNILFEAVVLKAKTFEIPIDFVDRTRGTSKLGFFDIVEFMYNAFWLRLRLLLG